jgi:hypothetical protein
LGQSPPTRHTPDGVDNHSSTADAYATYGWGNWTDSLEFSQEALESVFSFALSANAFRLTAAKDAAKAIDIAGSPDVKTKWRDTIRANFGEQNLIWNDFFNNAVIWIGRIQGTQGVVGFYNPWLDVIMLSQWQGPVQDQRLLDFEFIIGETWRAERTEEGVRVPHWQREHAIVTVSLAKYYHASLGVFNSFYPLKGEFVFLPRQLKDRMSDYKLDLVVFHTRATDRISMFTGYLQPKESVTTTTAIREQVDALRSAMSTGDRVGISAIVASQIRADVVNWIAQLPQTVRSTLFPAHYYVKDNRAVVTLVSPFSPKWFVAAYFQIDAQEPQLETIELCELEVAKALLQATGVHKENE